MGFAEVWERSIAVVTTYHLQVLSEPVSASIIPIKTVYYSLYKVTTYHSIVVKQLYNNNGRTLCQHGGVPVELDLLKDESLVPGGTKCLVQDLRSLTLSGEDNSGVGVRETGGVSTEQVPCLVDVSSELVRVRLCKR